MKTRPWILLAALGASFVASAQAAEDEPPPVIEGKPVPTSPVTPATPPAPATPGGPTAPAATAVASGDPVACDELVASCGQAVVRCEDALMQATEELALVRADELRRASLADLTGDSNANRTPAIDEPGGRDQVASIVKGMKPREAAAMVALWDEGLGADILARLSPRQAAPVLAAMPPATSARLTARIAAGGL